MATTFLPTFRGVARSAFALGVLALGGLWGQPGASVFQKAPPAVDEALRKRVNEFFQTHVDGKTRQALAMVAEESADAFFNAQKPKLQSFEIQQVNYAKNFQEATVLILAEREMMIPMAGVQMLKVPMESSWRLVDGKWLWYIPARDCTVTPFGCAPNNTTAASSKEPKLSREEIAAKIKMMSERNFDGQFGFDKGNVELGGATRSLELTFRNDLDGWVELKMVQAFSDPDFEIVGGEVQVKPQSSAKVIVRLKKGVTVTQLRTVRVPLFVQPFFRTAGLVVTVKPGA